MIQPTIGVIESSRSIIEAFGGYNHNLRISEGEFYDMENLTSSYYPALSARDKHGIYASPQQPQGLISKDALCYVDGTDFIINDYRIELNLSAAAEYCPKQLVSMGAYVIIMPDKKYVNTHDLSDYGDIEASFATADNTEVNFSMCRIDGTTYGSPLVSDSEPQNPQNMDLWIDSSIAPHTLRQYSASSEMWVAIATTYIKISAPNIAFGFKQYDAVYITGIDANLSQLAELNDKTSVIYEAYHEEGGENDYIVVVGMLDEVATQSSPITISRRMPKLDFVIEANNRLWGCRYGDDIDGNIVNEIYASKQGDFKNWNCFMGLSTDSYAASCGTDGQWTGAINYLGYPLFFKENCLHKVYGNFPSNFQIQSTTCRGVQKGAGNSLAILNEKLLYKSRNGICVYDGSLPGDLSNVFGDIHYSAVDESMTSEWSKLRAGAAAGVLNNKYYISMKSEMDSNWHLFVFDMSVGIWHREDTTRAKAFCTCRNNLYFIDNNYIKSVIGTDESTVKWKAETGIIGMAAPDKKYISRLLVRMSLDVGTTIRFYIQYDSSNEWEEIYSTCGQSLRSFAIPIRPRRCDHFRLKIDGKGGAKIYSIVKTLEQGSDY